MRRPLEMPALIRLFFATDVHGSEVCWRKFISAAKFYDANLLILGGDMTGKAIVPIIAQAEGRHKVTLLEQETILEGPDEVRKMVETIQNRGYYPYVTSPEEVRELSDSPGRSEALFLQESVKTVERWMAYADERLDELEREYLVIEYAGTDMVFVPIHQIHHDAIWILFFYPRNQTEIGHVHRVGQSGAWDLFCKTGFG